MKGFTAGMLTGGLAAAMGIGFVLSDRNAKQKLARGGRVMACKAFDMADDISMAADKMEEML